MKIISLETSTGKLYLDRLWDKTLIGTSDYQVRFSVKVGDIDIRLHGKIAGKMRAAINAIPPDEDTPERQVVVALNLLAALGMLLDN